MQRSHKNNHQIQDKPDDISRLRREYNAREKRLSGSDIYSSSNLAFSFMQEQEHQNTMKLLKENTLLPLSGKNLLEIGCGSGGIIHEYNHFGAVPEHLFGIDLLFNRLETAHQKLPGNPLACADGQDLPFRSFSFDIVLQYTALSSLLDENIRKKVAREMLRVLTPRGTIISYDFWINPSNKQTRGLTPWEIRKLFPGCFYEFHRITLAPPITRGLIHLSRRLCLFLEKTQLFNSHYLTLIKTR